MRRAYEFDPTSHGAAYGYAFIVDAAGRYGQSRVLWEEFLRALAGQRADVRSNSGGGPEWRLVKVR